MSDFIFSALPWVVLGITVAIVLTNINNKKKKRNVTENQDYLENINTMNKEENTEDYMSTGLSLGMGFGVAIGSSLIPRFGESALTYGICFGMLCGMLVGMYVKKK